MMQIEWFILLGAMYLYCLLIWKSGGGCYIVQSPAKQIKDVLLA
jgi:hypothetical protein